MEQRKKKISISVAISFLTLIASFLTSFLFTKFLLSQEQIGDVNYGLKTTADSFVSFVSVFTVGMSSTFIRFHKKYEKDERSVFSAFNLITLIIALAAIAFGLVLFILTVNCLILNPANGTYTQQQVYDFAAILVISISYMSLSTILGNSKWYLESTKHIVLVRVVNLFVVILYPIVSTIFVLMGANMVWVTLTYSLVYLLGFVFYLVYRIKKTKSASFLKITNLKHDLFKEILVFCFFVVLAGSIETLNHSVDKLILTISLEAASLTTIYQLSMTLNQVLLSLTDIIYAPYMPYIADDIVSGNQENVQKTFDKVNFLLLYLSFLVFTGFTACGKEFVVLWVGEGKELVYYFGVVLFALWPLYGMVKFSNSVQRLAAKHYRSTALFLISFVLHLGITVAFVKLIGIWSCIIGTAVGNVFLGVTFLFYNKKYLQLKQQDYIKNFLLLAVSSAIAVGAAFAIDWAIASFLPGASNTFLFFAKGVSSFFIFLLSAAIVYWKKFKDLFGRTFIDSYSVANYGGEPYISSIKHKFSPHRGQINKFFPVVLIFYFALNFASYYLGGLAFMTFVVNSSAFSYGSKLLSYALILVYGVIFALANDCKINRKGAIVFAFVFCISIVSAFVVPKAFSVVGVNQYNWTVKTTVSLGLKDVMIGNLNWLIDLAIMYFYLYIFRQHLSSENTLAFMRFIVVFTLIECLYSFVFQSEDYLYFFSKVSGGTGFTGYTTNLSGTFASKNGFGFLLFQAIIASFYLVIHDRRIKPFLYWIPFALFNLVSILSLCKTSAFSAFVFDIILFVYWLKKKWISNKKIFFVTVSLLASAILFIGLCFAPFMQAIPSIERVMEKINSIFLVSGSATFRSRIVIWEYALKLVKGPYIIFGYGKTASAYFLRVASNFTTSTFHNGVLDVLCSYGIFGLALYIYAIRRAYKETARRSALGIDQVILIAVVVTTLLYGLMENVFLLISSSSTMLVSNIVLSIPTHNEVRKGEFGGVNYTRIDI